MSPERARHLRPRRPRRRRAAATEALLQGKQICRGEPSGTPVACTASASSPVLLSPANSASPLTAVFVLWIFLHSAPSPVPSPPPPPPSFSVVGSLPLRRRHPVTFCKHFIRERLVFSKTPRQTDRAAVNRSREGNEGAHQWKGWPATTMWPKFLRRGFNVY